MTNLLYSMALSVICLRINPVSTYDLPVHCCSSDDVVIDTVDQSLSSKLKCGIEQIYTSKIVEVFFVTVSERKLLWYFSINLVSYINIIFCFKFCHLYRYTFSPYFSSPLVIPFCLFLLYHDSIVLIIVFPSFKQLGKLSFPFVCQYVIINLFCHFIAL